MKALKFAVITLVAASVALGVFAALTEKGMYSVLSFLGMAARVDSGSVTAIVYPADSSAAPVEFFIEGVTVSWPAGFVDDSGGIAPGSAKLSLNVKGEHATLFVDGAEYARSAKPATTHLFSLKLGEGRHEITLASGQSKKTIRVNVSKNLRPTFRKTESAVSNRTDKTSSGTDCEINVSIENENIHAVYSGAKSSFPLADIPFRRSGYQVMVSNEKNSPVNLEKTFSCSGSNAAIKLFEQSKGAGEKRFHSIFVHIVKGEFRFIEPPNSETRFVTLPNFLATPGGAILLQESENELSYLSGDVWNKIVPPVKQVAGSGAVHSSFCGKAVYEKGKVHFSSCRPAVMVRRMSGKLYVETSNSRQPFGIDRKEWLFEPALFELIE